MKYSDKKIQEYTAAIAEWDWQTTREQCDRLIMEQRQQGTYDEGDLPMVYIGTVMQLYPSSKYYACWTTNQTARDILLDEWYTIALNKIADRHNAYVDFDGSDMFIGFYGE